MFHAVTEDVKTVSCRRYVYSKKGIELEETTFRNHLDIQCDSFHFVVFCM
jgi:predicted nucleic-acid-binding Zn-ribbon protein